MIQDRALTSREIRAVEMNTEYLGVSKLQLMENAGQYVAKAIIDRFGSENTVVLVCGPGGNGGDGFVSARHLAEAGYNVEVFLLGSSENIQSEETLANWRALKQMKASVFVKEIHDSAEVEPLEADVIVDALIGTGVRGALSTPCSEMVQAINKAKSFKIAVDVPTGVESDTGKAHGEAVTADLTLTFHKSKAGFKKAEKYIGKLEVCSIGVPPEAELFIGPGDVHLVSRQRLSDSHKGDFGRLLVVGGSETYSGAPALTAMGAYAAGVDLVQVAAPEKSASIIAGFNPNMITVKLEGGHLTPQNILKLHPLLERVDAVAMGPGLDLHSETIEAVEKLLEWVEEKNLPVLLDADALKGFAQKRQKIEAPAVFTPHGGEFRILTGRSADGDFKAVGETVQMEAAKLGATILLKGSVDVVSDGVRIRYNWTGNPGMTVGGTGDVLSGVTAAFMAMGFSPFEAAAAGAFINGAAGDAAYNEKGYHLLPTDLIEHIPWVMEDALAGCMSADDR